MMIAEHERKLFRMFPDGPVENSLKTKCSDWVLAIVENGKNGFG